MPSAVNFLPLKLFTTILKIFYSQNDPLFFYCPLFGTLFEIFLWQKNCYSCIRRKK